MSGPAALLLRYTPPPAAIAALPAFFDAVEAAQPRRWSRMEANRAVDGSMLYVFLWTARADLLTDVLEDTAMDIARHLMPPPVGGELEPVRLRPVQDMPGASHGQPAGYHYVVETDVQPVVAQDLADWYGKEHLPGLASVPGNVRARRLESTNADGSTRSWGCYDLTAPETLKSAPWLAVRATAWSDKVRPFFCNTRRTMFERLQLQESSQQP